MKANNRSIKPPIRASLFLLLALSGHTLPAAGQSQGTFTPAGSMTTPRYGHTATLLLDGKVLIAGGMGSRAYGELYDPATGAFTPTGDMITARSFHTATLLPDGRVLLAGGHQVSDSLLSAELYDPETGVFTATAFMNAASSFHTATLLNNGSVLIAGGGLHTHDDATPRLIAELYNPATGKFANTATMTVPQFGPTATLLGDGSVLVASPNLYPNLPLVIVSQVQSFGATSEVYSSPTGTFSHNNSGDGLFFMHTATLLPSGSVLLAGGRSWDGSGIVLASALLYSPRSGTFTPTGSMTAHRSWHAASLLPDGNVLITGGTATTSGVSAPITLAEVYAPHANSFSAAGQMTAGRMQHTATLLNDGTLLITGGTGSDSSSRYVAYASAELYRPSTLISGPLLFSMEGEGNQQAAIWHSATGRLVSADTPARAGDALSMYTTALGEGSVIPPRVTIGGKLAEILFFGDAPGHPGFSQVNVRMPNGAAPATAVPLRLRYLERSSNEVTIAVQ